MIKLKVKNVLMPGDTALLWTTPSLQGKDVSPSIWLVGPDGKIVARDLHGKALQ